MEIQEKTTVKYEEQQSVDIISEIYRKSAFHILELIVKYLDADSLRCAEAVSESWKVAISSLCSEKIWESLLKAKISQEPIWKDLYDLDEQYDNLAKKEVREEVARVKYLGFRNVYSKYEFAIKEVDENWQKDNAFTRETIQICNENEGITQLLVMEKYIVLYNYFAKIFKVWNRESLTQKIVFQVPELAPFLTSLSRVSSRIIGEILVYPTSQCRLVFFDLCNGTHSLQSPLINNPDESYISFFYVTNQQIAICVRSLTAKEDVDFDLYLWQYSKLDAINWDDYQKIGFHNLLNVTMMCDSRFLFLQFFESDRIYLDIRDIKSLNTQVVIGDKNIPVTRGSVFYEGLVFYIHNTTIRAYDCESKVTWTIGNVAMISKLVKSSNFLHACHWQEIGKMQSRNRPVMLLTISSWKFKDISNRMQKLVREPFCRLEACVPYFTILFVDDKTVTMVSTNRANTKIEIHQLNFLPRCHFCNKISNSLSRCALCFSVKYCSSICELADRNNNHDKKCLNLAEWYYIQENYLLKKNIHQYLGMKLYAFN